MAVLGHFGRFLVISGDFGSIEGPGGVGMMVDRSGRGQLRAWQVSGEGSGTEVGKGSGSDFGHFGLQGSKFEGPRSIFGLRGQNLGVGVGFLVSGVKI